MAVTLLAGLLLIFLYIIIFTFSAQNGETSGNISMDVSGFGVGILDKLTGGRLSQETLRQLTLAIEHPLRKTAHFLEYALMGILVYCLLYYHVHPVRRRCLLAVIWVFFSAAFDELHQYFVPGRWGGFLDVYLDTCGGIAGIIFCVFITRQSLLDKKRD